jgi:hypothetical protein
MGVCSFFKIHITCTSLFFGDRKISIAIQHTPPSDDNRKGLAYAIIFKEFFFSLAFPLGLPKNFGRHPMMCVSWMATKVLQLSFDNGVMSNCNQRFFYHHPIHPQLFDGDKNKFGRPKRHGVKGMK